MNRYINVENYDKRFNLIGFSNDFCKGVNTVLWEIEHTKTADVQLVVHAHWIEHKLAKGGSVFECSNCGEDNEFEVCSPQASCYYYCPYCGAEMDGDEHG